MRSNLGRVFLLATLLAAAAIGCGGHSSANNEPIPECQEYDRLFASCMGRTSDVAGSALVSAKSDAEREQMRTLCASNLQRLQTACR